MRASFSRLRFMSISDPSRAPAGASGHHGNDLPVADDRIFDGLADKFANSLYGTARGAIRLAVLDHLLDSALPADGSPALDVGGGLGQMSAWLADRGHAVTLAEPSAEMLAAARTGMGTRDVTYLASTLQALPAAAPGPWPLVVCHAVLEWLAQPQAAIATLAALMAPGARLSLMVFNRDALRLSNIVKGNLDKAWEDRLSGTGKRQRLTPISPLTHDDIVAWCREAGLVIEQVSGVRVFHDYLGERGIGGERLETLIALEKRYCQSEPYWRLGRYLHYRIRRPERPLTHCPDNPVPGESR